MQFDHTFLYRQFGGGPFGDQGWCCQHVEKSWASPKQIIIDLPSEEWMVEDGSEAGRGLDLLSQKVTGAVPWREVTQAP